LIIVNFFDFDLVTGESLQVICLATGELIRPVTARERPDSFVDLIYSLHQATATSPQMGAHSSKDLRPAAGPATAAAAMVTAKHDHRHRKSSRVWSSERVLARALQALSDPYCHSTCLLNISET